MTLLRWIAVALFASAALVAVAYFRDIDRAYQRIGRTTQLFESADGIVEFTQGGSGPAVLVIHGSGGGYDQGELIAHAVLGDGFHWIAPSRFGYLRSTVRRNATFDDQALAYTQLLDHLGIEKVAVVALSHGGPSALLLAALYPERVASLTLISCGVASSSDPDQAQANQKGNALKAIFSHDPLYWAVSTLFRKQLMSLLGAGDEVVAGLTPDRRRLVDEVIDTMNPVAPRSVGVDFDNRATMPNERIGAIRAPTLIFHARDDGLQLFRNAEFAAATIPGARLQSFAAGGHLLIATQQDAIRASAQEFIRAHSPSRF